MESFFRGIIRFRGLVIAVVLGCTVLAWIQLQTLYFEGDAEAMFPSDDPVLSYGNLVEDRFGMRDLIIVGVLNPNPDENGVFNPRTLGIVKEFSEQIARLPGIKAVRDEDVASVATMDNITGTLDGMAVDPFMETVPDTQDALASLKQALFSNSMFVNWVVSQDGTGLLIMAKMEESSEGASQDGRQNGHEDAARAGTARRMAVYTAIRDMLEAKKATGVPEEFHIAGRGAMEVTFAEGARGDMQTSLPLILVIILGTLYCTYRSLRGVLLPLAVVVVAVIWTLGTMAAVGIPMYSITIMMPVVLMAVGVADGIHILSRYYDELLEHPDVSSADAVLVAMREMWQPVVFTSLTTAVGFLSFLTAALVPIRYFGVFTALGVLVAMVFSITFFPAMLSLLPPKVSRGLRNQMGRSGDLAATGWAASLLSRLGLGVARHPLAVWVPTVIIIGTCLIGAQRIVVDTSIIRMAAPNNPVRIADGILRDRFQGTLPLYVAIEGHNPDLLKDPILLDKLDRLQAEVEQDPVVGGSVSLAEYVKRMHRIMNEDRPEMEVIPASQDLVAQYLLLYSFSGDPDDFDEIVDYDYQHANVSVYLRSDSTQDIQRVVERVQDFAVREFGRLASNEAQAEPDSVFVRFGRWLAGIPPTLLGWETNSGFRIGFAGNSYLTSRMSELVVTGQLSSLVTSLGAVFVLTTLMFRSWVAGLINVIPISLVMIFSFGLLGLLGIPLEIGKSMTASMVIGIGIDYTIHFLNKYRVKVREGLQEGQQAGQIDTEQITVATMATSGKAIFFNAVVVIGGFLVLLTASYRPNFFLGVMMALNMGACLLVSMTVLPAMLNTFQPRFVYGAEKAPVLESRPEYGVE